MGRPEVSGFHNRIPSAKSHHLQGGIMNEKPANLWDRWLLLVGWLLMVFGLLLGFFNQTAPFDIAFNHQINPVFWTDGTPPEGVEAFQSWIYGVLGCTVSGWGVFLVFLARRPFRKRERWARNCIFAGITLWYITDTSVSLYFGVTFNAVFNTALALLVYVPLLATRGEFGNQS
jgi:hypothetical protein